MRVRRALARADRTVQAVVLEGFLNRLGFGIVTFALPLYALSLGLSITEIGIVVAAKALVQPAVKPLTGLLIDRLDARRAYLVAVGLRFASALALPFSTSLEALVGVRLLQGAASAAQDPAAIAVIARRDATRLGRRFAATMSARDVGKVSAGLLGGLLLAATGSFLLLWVVVIAIAALPLAVVWAWVRELPAVPAEEAGPGGEDATRVLRHPRLRLIAALGLLAGTTAQMTHALFQVYAAEVAGLDPAQIGLVYSLSIAALLLVGPPAGWVADRFGTGPLAGVRGIANAASSLLYLLWPAFGGMLAGRLVDDAGKAAFRPAWGALVGAAARTAGRRGGRVAGTLDAALSLGEALGPLLAALLWDAAGIAVFLGVRAALGVATELLVGRRLRLLAPADGPVETAPEAPGPESASPPGEGESVRAWLERRADGARPEELARAWREVGLADRLGLPQAAWERAVETLGTDDRRRLSAAVALALEPEAVPLAAWAPPAEARSRGRRR